MSQAIIPSTTHRYRRVCPWIWYLFGAHTSSCTMMRKKNVVYMCNCLANGRRLVWAYTSFYVCYPPPVNDIFHQIYLLRNWFPIFHATRNAMDVNESFCLLIPFSPPLVTRLSYSSKWSWMFKMCLKPSTETKTYFSFMRKVFFLTWLTHVPFPLIVVRLIVSGSGKPMWNHRPDQLLGKSQLPEINPNIL